MKDLLTHAGLQLNPRVLTDDQAAVIRKLHLSLGKGHTRVMVQAPTGFGKTVIIAKLVKSAVDAGQRVLITVTRLELINQTMSALSDEGVFDVGILQGNNLRSNYLADVQVATLQTLARRKAIPSDFDLVLVDECHENHKILYDLMDRWTAVPFIGFSATPWAKGMGKHWGPLIQAATLQSLIDQGRLSQFRVFAPDTPDLTHVKVVAGEYNGAQTERIMAAPQLIGSVVETWLEKGDDRPTLCFCVNRAHARSVANRFTQKGIAAAYVDGRTDSVERELIRQKYAAGEIRIVCSVRTMTTGIDWPVSCIIDAAPTRSEILHVQKIGRGLRIKPGTEDLVVLDHAGNTLRLGLVTDIHNDQLDDGTKRKRASAKRKVPLPRPCIGCGVLFIGQRCEHCGHLREALCKVTEADGELVEYTSSDRPEPTVAIKQDWYGQLRHIAGSRGYKLVWADKNFQRKFGCAPTGLQKITLKPTRPVLNYVQSDNIRFAKQKEKRA